MKYNSACFILSLLMSLLLVQPVAGVTFLDGGLPRDEFNFLATTFPKYIQKSKELPKEDEEKEIPEVLYLRILTGIFETPVYHPLLYELKEEGSTKQKSYEWGEITKKREACHARSVFDEFVYKHKMRSDLTILEDVALAAYQIEDVLIREDTAPVIFLGRTPCFVQVAYEELCNLKKRKDHIIHLSFSGTPDTLTLRSGTYYQDAEGNIVRNMVTQEKLNFYQDYLTQKGLHKAGKKLYVVDGLGTGASLNGFLRLLRSYYQREKQEMPEVHFICLSLTMGSDCGFSDIWRFEQKSKTLTFNSSSMCGIRAMEVRTTPLQLSTKTLSLLLDNDLNQRLAVHGIEFPAQKWRKEFNGQLSQGAKWHEKAYALLRPRLREFVLTHEKELREELAKLLD